MDLVLLLVGLNDRETGVLEDVEALLDGLNVVIVAARALTALEKTFQHDLLGALKVEDDLGGDNDLFKLDSLVHLAREAVNQETGLAFLLDGLLHGVLKQGNRDLHRHDQTLADIVANQIAIFGTLSLLLSTQQITRRQMHKVVVALQILALRTLASTGAT